jgi:alcohol dehydrogenase
MKALVYHGPGAKAWEDIAAPVLVADTDAIIRVETTTICGTDLHILKGDVPAMRDGRIIGHEAVGTVTQVGTAVKNARVGDRVLVSCVSACGAAGSAASAATGSAPAGAAGFSVTRSTAPRPSTYGFRSRTTRPTRYRPGSATRSC